MKRTWIVEFKSNEWSATAIVIDMFRFQEDKTKNAAHEITFQVVRGECMKIMSSSFHPLLLLTPALLWPVSPNQISCIYSLFRCIVRARTEFHFGMADVSYIRNSSRWTRLIGFCWWRDIVRVQIGAYVPQLVHPNNFIDSKTKWTCSRITYHIAYDRLIQSQSHHHTLTNTQKKLPIRLFHRWRWPDDDSRNFEVVRACRVCTSRSCRQSQLHFSSSSFYRKSREKTFLPQNIRIAYVTRARISLTDIINREMFLLQKFLFFSQRQTN